MKVTASVLNIINIILAPYTIHPRVIYVIVTLSTLIVGNNSICRLAIFDICRLAEFVTNLNLPAANLAGHAASGPRTCMSSLTRERNAYKAMIIVTVPS